MITHEALLEELHYDPNSGLFTRNNGRGANPVGSVFITGRSIGYRAISVKNKSYLAHRLAWMYVYGAMPIMDIDHKNGEKDDNRIENLRIATKLQNNQNQKKPRANNTSGLLGVSWHKKAKKWLVQIKVNSVKKYIGIFDSKDAASAAYWEAKKKYHTSAFN